MSDTLPGTTHPDDNHDRAGIRGLFSDADAYHLDQAFPLLMKQLELMLTGGELNPRHQHTVTLYAKGLTCEADTLGSCGYVYLAVYPTPAAPAITV
ncbi:type IV toxin-antitoxin system YeeU family antitoxin [Escherichia coli]